MALKTITFNYTGELQTWTPPVGTERIKIECYGAVGGNDGGGIGGYGGYSYGEYVFKTQISTLYIYVGRAGVSGASGSGGGWNGGGNAGPSGSSGGGGGASDVRIFGDSVWSNNLDKRIIVAGGGGGAGNGPNGGAGGGVTGNTGSGGATGGSQTSGGTGSRTGGFGYGASHPGDGGGAGGGYYGGGSGNGDAGGGGGSSYIALLENSGTTTGINNGNGKVVITFEEFPLKLLLQIDDMYYIPQKQYYDVRGNFFKPLSSDDIFSIINNNDNTQIYKLDNINSPFDINGETIIPSKVIAFEKCKLCVISKLNIKNIIFNYSPSIYSLSKTTIKIKEKYTPLSENLKNAYLNIIGTNESGIGYTIDYEKTFKAVSNNNAYLIDTEILKDDFYLSFIFNKSVTMLTTITLSKNDSVTYSKIENDNSIITNDFIDTFVNFERAYGKVLINRITKTYFKYYDDSLDKF